MPTLQWSDSFVLGLPFMDDTHHEFINLLNAVHHATDDTRLTTWQALMTLTAEHFSQEDQWMMSTGFSSSNCHSIQHRVILQVMQEGAERAQSGEIGVIEQMAQELGAWFLQHIQTMDAALALHLRSVGYDLVTNRICAPEALPHNVIHGCGSSACSNPKTSMA